jgi:membrane-associated phospholipid phosphatase
MKQSAKPKTDKIFINPFFWQPKFDLLRLLNKNQIGRTSVIILNYFIWFFLFYISFLLIKNQTNIFWQLLLATMIGETIEKYGKTHALWRRPLYMKNDTTPIGLVDRWYKTGSFPSGHTIKAVYFFMFILQYNVIDPVIYLLVVIPLLIFRIIIGFHYPVDMVGGAVIGLVLWLLTHQIIAPVQITEFVRVIFNFVFHIQ